MSGTTSRTGMTAEAAAGEIAEIGQTLATAIGEIVRAVHGDLRRPNELSNRLQLDKVLTSRVLKAIRNNDPVAVVHQIPGPDSIRRMIRAVPDGAVDVAMIEVASDAIDRFEAFIRHHAGDRSRLDAILSNMLPEARAKTELAAKQAVFKGMSQLRGLCAETDLFTAILHPSADGAHLDQIWMGGQIGLRRLRPGLIAKYSSIRAPSADAAADANPAERAQPPRTLADEPVQSLDGVMLREYCSDPPPDLHVEARGSAVHYVLSGDAIGPTTGATVMLAVIHRERFAARLADALPGRRQLGVSIGIPTKAAVLDVLMHNDAWPDARPTVSVFDPALKERVNIEEQGFDLDRLDLIESMEFLGSGRGRLHAANVPRYAEMVEHACDRVGWSIDDFRIHRCQLAYPVYGSQIIVGFE